MVRVAASERRATRRPMLTPPAWYMCRIVSPPSSRPGRSLSEGQNPAYSGSGVSAVRRPIWVDVDQVLAWPNPVPVVTVAGRIRGEIMKHSVAKGDSSGGERVRRALPEKIKAGIFGARQVLVDLERPVTRHQGE